MAGHWTARLGRANFEELWLPPAGGAMIGLSRTIAASRMVEFEYLRIVQRPDGVYYVAQPNGRPATDFRLTQSQAQQAVFSNPAHDFPQVITYTRSDPNTLRASIEGKQNGQPKKIEFQFTRVTP